MLDSRLTRRNFLEGSIASGVALGLGAAGAQARPAAAEVATTKATEFKISLAEWSLHKALRAKKLTNLDFPKVARDEYGIEAIEFVNQFFKDKAHDADYLKELKKRAQDSGVTCVLIMIDGEGDLSAPDKAERDKAVKNHSKWVDAAAALGCHAIRVNTGNHYSPTNVTDIAEACAELTDYGVKHGIEIICENHGGPSSNPDALIALMKAVGKPTFGTLPDFGNFPKDKSGQYTIDIYDAITRMMPYAKGVSAKSFDFDSTGAETKLDYPRILKIVTSAGYHSYVGIEYEGERMSEPEGIKATKKLLEMIQKGEHTAVRPRGKATLRAQD